jgi:gliding motility-associated-like protein
VVVLPYDVLAPNIFTPNGDGTNDFFVIKNLEFFPNTKIQIYDRWGALIYENGNYFNEWNGNKNSTNTKCTDGTYYYILSGPYLNKSITGFVQLIRGK